MQQDYRTPASEDLIMNNALISGYGGHMIDRNGRKGLLLPVVHFCEDAIQ